jgi:hypothetical protein
VPVPIGILLELHFPAQLSDPQTVRALLRPGLFRLTADKITRIFGFRLHRRFRGKLQTVLENIGHGHHVLRACAKNAVLRMYEKFSTFLRLEVLSNNLRDFGQKGVSGESGPGSANAGRRDGSFAGFEAEALNVPVDFQDRSR